MISADNSTYNWLGFEEFNTDVLYDTLTQITELFAAYPSHSLQAVDGACNILYLSLSLLPEGEKTLEQIFSEYITQKKVARAKAILLEENMKIYEVADKLGFESAFYFSKVFKKVEGISPREFIQDHLASPEEYQD